MGEPPNWARRSRPSSCRGSRTCLLSESAAGFRFLTHPDSRIEDRPAGDCSLSHRSERGGTGYLLRVASPLSSQEKLRIKFRKSLRKDCAKNIEIDPVAPDTIALITEPQEAFIVRVDSTKGQHYWFSDRRLLCQHNQGIDELLRYKSVYKAHWMFRDLTDRLKSSPEAISQLKRSYFDRLEIESKDRLVILEGLGRAYWPVLHFFRWIERPSAAPTPQPGSANPGSSPR